MSIIASVPCRCFVEGKATPPPFDPSLLEIDEHGGVVLKNGQDQPKFWDWHKTACQHSFMDAAELCLNWFWFRQIEWALAIVNDDKGAPCESLRRIIPTDAFVWTPGRLASDALKELPLFQQRAAKIESAFLVESSEGRVLHDYCPAYEGIFQFGAGQEMGVDMAGFFIKEQQGKELFRAMRFEQQVMSSEEVLNEGKGEVEFHNLDSGTRFVAKYAVSRPKTPEATPVVWEHPRAWHVDLRPLGENYFDYFATGMREVLMASIATGNDILWG